MTKSWNFNKGGPIKVGCGSTAWSAVIRDEAVIKLSIPILKGITVRWPIYVSESAQLMTLGVTLIIAPGTYSPSFRQMAACYNAESLLASCLRGLPCT